MELLGIKTCDTCRKALKELEVAGCDVTFTDIRVTPLDRATLADLHDRFGDALVNRRSTTWRGLDDAARSGDPVALLVAHPTLMKRPVIRHGKTVTLGWDAAARAAHLG